MPSTPADGRVSMAGKPYGSSLRSIVLAIRHHISRRTAMSTRIFHLTDSYVCVSIIGKGRSGSKKLGRVLKQLNSLLLGFDLYLIIGHVELVRTRLMKHRADSVLGRRSSAERAHARSHGL